MKTSYSEQDFLVLYMKGRLIQTFITWLLAYFPFILRKNQKEFISLSDPAWVEQAGGNFLQFNCKGSRFLGFSQRSSPPAIGKECLAMTLWRIYLSPADHSVLKEERLSMVGSLMYLTASRPDIMFAEKPSLAVAYSKESPLELVLYRLYSDYAGATQDRKSTTRGCQFLGNRLISWQCKKQTVVATSTTEAEYVAAASCCGQQDFLQKVLMLVDFSTWSQVLEC
ncbi:hypothetical protein Tco_0937968 [Tanacetum coccineum]|uniref:Uncharacterized protein n=1 Tax=Tanacetum coccineum TaxID=301880 RepID=A0ABQ5DHQ7_9ASTR